MMASRLQALCLQLVSARMGTSEPGRSRTTCNAWIGGDVLVQSKKLSQDIIVGTEAISSTDGLVQLGVEVAELAPSRLTKCVVHRGETYILVKVLAP